MTEQNDAIGPGTAVVMHYRIRLEDGTEADSTFDEEPLSFTVGDGTLIEGLEEALFGLMAGERSTITLAPEQAFGFHEPNNVHVMALSEFGHDLAPEPGQVIGFSTPSGEELPGTVLEVANGFVRVDFNHPFAGHQLEFEVKILKVSPAA